MTKKTSLHRNLLMLKSGQDVLQGHEWKSIGKDIERKDIKKEVKNINKHRKGEFMTHYNIVNGPANVSSIILGCMRMPALSVKEATMVIDRANELGINFYDHATCYGKGEAEKRFGDALKTLHIEREDIFIQSKCGLTFERGTFDWSKENILTSVDEILSRLQTDYLDALLLHRPDVLFDPEEVAEAFDILERNKKVRHFGVSNLAPLQIELLRKYVKQPLVFNQLQLSITESYLIDQALYLNNKTTEMSINRDGNVLDYCRLHDITVQAWSPLQFGFFEGCFINHEKFPELNAVLAQMSEKYGISKTGIAIAWILRHPAKIQAIAGTMNPKHLEEFVESANITLTREDWYKLYLASGKFLP